ncbi:hypothetical protein KP509_27G010100 [Ceratopteris richardii]|nr:hypothetical protein KP509_27G010100 [Ceratopteris richardii]
MHKTCRSSLEGASFFRRWTSVSNFAVRQGSLRAEGHQCPIGALDGNVSTMLTRSKDTGSVTVHCVNDDAHLVHAFFFDST